MLAGCAGVTLPHSHGLTDCSALLSHQMYASRFQIIFVVLLNLLQALGILGYYLRQNGSCWTLFACFSPFLSLTLLSKPLLFMHR